MPTLTILHGLPGSGKSTIANSLDAVKVELDEIRYEFFKAYDGLTTYQTSTAFAVRNTRIRKALEAGKDVVSSDTNLFKWQVEEVEKIGRLVGATIRHIFVDTPLAECHRRNSLRSRVVPANVINEMAKKVGIGDDGFIPREKYVATDELTKLPTLTGPFILVDVDGTLADNNELAVECFVKGPKKQYDRFFREIAVAKPVEIGRAHV